MLVKLKVVLKCDPMLGHGALMGVRLFYDLGKDTFFFLFFFFFFFGGGEG